MEHFLVPKLSNAALEVLSHWIAHQAVKLIHIKYISNL